MQSMARRDTSGGMSGAAARDDSNEENNTEREMETMRVMMSKFNQSCASWLDHDHSDVCLILNFKLFYDEIF